MLDSNDIRIDTGRAAHGGDFRRMIHIPTGIVRVHPGPMRGVNWDELQQQWLREIETELLDRGLNQDVVEASSKKTEIEKILKQRLP